MYFDQTAGPHGRIASDKQSRKARKAISFRVLKPLVRSDKVTVRYRIAAKSGFVLCRFKDTGGHAFDPQCTPAARKLGLAAFDVRAITRRIDCDITASGLGPLVNSRYYTMVWARHRMH